MTRIGKYLIRREIGRGGMAIVYEAEDPDLHRAIALKVFASSDPDSAHVKRFHREASLAASLRHPNIIAVHDVGQAPGESGATLHYIAMDLVPGRTFQEFLGTPDALRMLEDVARAVGHAHSHGVIHRDLKPANVLVDASGRVVLTDFGLARAESETRLTRDGAVLGTPVYMAPEQVLGDNHAVGVRTDVYALGVMLYEILSGAPPFVAATAAEVYAHILTSDPPRPRGARADLEAICFKAMEREPGRRYGNGAEFADDVARAMRGDPVLATRPGVVSRLVRRALRRPAWVVSALLLIVAITWIGIVQVRGRVRLREALARAASPASLEAERDAWREAAGLGDANAQREFERVTAMIRQRDEKREAARRATDERSAAQERAFKQLELGRPSLDQAIALLYKKDAAYADLCERANKAIDAFRGASAEASWLAQPHYLLGRALDALGDWPAAEAAWRRAVERDPAFGPAHFQLGRVLLLRSFFESTGTSVKRRVAGRERARKLTDEAISEFDAAVRAGSGFDDALGRDLAVVMRSYVINDLASVQRLTAEGIATYGTRDGAEDFHWLSGLAAERAEGLRAHAAALTIRPHHAAALFSRGLYHLHDGNRAEAIDDFGHAIDFSPRFVHAWNNRGTARLTLGDLDGAIRDFGVALGIDVDYADALVNRGLALATKAERLAGIGRAGEAGKLWDEAMRDYMRAIDLVPDCAEAYVNRGSVNLATGDLASALRSYSKAVELDPDLINARYNRGLARRRSGDVKGAIDDYNECIRRDARWAAAYWGRGIAYQELNDHKAAIADYTRLLELEPRHHSAFGNRGVSKLNLGDYDGAIDDFTRALELSPGYLEAIANRGLARSAKKDWDGAIADLEEVLRRAPDGWPSRATLQRALEDAKKNRE